MSIDQANETRQDIVVGNTTGAQPPAKRRHDHNEVYLRKRTDLGKLGELSGVQTKGQFSPKYVEDNLVTGVCGALEKINSQKMFRKQAPTLEQVVADIITYDFVLARMARVAAVYQARNPNSEHHRVLLPLDPLDQDPDQADLATIVAEVVRRIPQLVPDARGVYEPVCTGFGNRPPELAGPAQNPPPAQGETDQTSE